MIPENWGNGHDEEEVVPGRISKTILPRNTVPGISSYTMADRVHLPTVRFPARVSSVQRTVSMRPLQVSDLCDSRDSAAKTHMPLRVWFLVFYLVCVDKRGISAVQLSTHLGMTYKME